MGRFRVLAFGRGLSPDATIPGLVAEPGADAAILDEVTRD
jgi:hypothetical protein